MRSTRSTRTLSIASASKWTRKINYCIIYISFYIELQICLNYGRPMAVGGKWWK